MNLLRQLVLLGAFLMPVQYLMAETYESGAFQTSLLELYTSEGCSSCPPAEAWLSQIKDKGFKPNSVVPLAFHVTYWDYLGWKDQFSKKEHDQRQREKVLQAGEKTVYTPQFLLNGQTLRNVSAAVAKVNSLNKSKADVNIKASVLETKENLLVDVALRQVAGQLNDIVKVNVVAYENHIPSAIKAGENAGHEFVHQYLVREMQTALMSLKKSKKRQFYMPRDETQNWAGLVVFVESDNKVVQVLDIPLKKRT